jgi:enediyne biosynthesis protein E4
MTTKRSHRRWMHQFGAVVLLPCLILSAGTWLEAPQAKPPPGVDSAGVGYTFTDVAAAAGLGARNYFGGEDRKKYILETTGSGAAFLDYDNDGWLDIFLVNGSRLEGFPRGQEPANHLYRNNHDGTFADVSEKSGLARHGWGQGVCAGDYDNDGLPDLFLTYWGENVLYRNEGKGTFADVTRKAGLQQTYQRWGTGCAFLDFDRDGLLDLFISNYLVFDLKNPPDPATNPYCRYRGLAVNCGPRGLQGETNLLYRNNGDGTFADVSEKAGIRKAAAYYGLGVLVGDFDNDEWPDVYVATDTTPSLLFRNNHNGTFTDIAVVAGCAYDENGKTQAGMGVTAADYDRDGWLDIFKTNFSEEMPNLYRNRGKANFHDAILQSGIGKNTRLVGWGSGFFDPDNDGWPDLFYCNGHIYPEIERAPLEVKYRQPRLLYRNLRNGRFEDVSAQVGEPITLPSTGRSCAFGDFDNDGDTDIVVNNMNDLPSLLRCDQKNPNHWIKIRLVGTRSNRSGIGARLKCVTGNLVQIDEVRSGGSFLSQNDLRVHFGLEAAERVDQLEIRWPSGQVDLFRNLPADRILTVREGEKLRGAQ